MMAKRVEVTVKRIELTHIYVNLYLAHLALPSHTPIKKEPRILLRSISRGSSRTAPTNPRYYKIRGSYFIGEGGPIMGNLFNSGS